MSEDPRLALDLLVEHELAIKQLYAIYAQAFADVRDFWRTLAGEEQGHADMLDGLRTEPAVDRWLQTEPGLRSQAIRSSIEHVHIQMSKVQEGGVTLLHALVVAKDLEEALIDRGGLLPDSHDCAEIARVLEEIRADTERHRRLVADALETERRLHM